MPLNRDEADGRSCLFPLRRTGNHLFEHFAGKILPDPVSLRCEMFMGHQGDDHDGDHQAHHGRKAIAPAAEDSGHLLFVRIPGGGRGIIADPAGPVQDRGHKENNDPEQIEIPQPADIERIQEVFPRHPVQGTLPAPEK